MHRLLHGVALLSLMAPAFNPSPTQAAESNEAPIRLLVPAYFYPAGEGLVAWKKLIASAEQTPVVAIVNPDSGPGKRVDAVYHEIFQWAKPSKIKLIGYVTLSYAERPISAVKADIDSWLHFYPEVAGIFFDEQPSQA
ncbi:MAG TPA: spherulation-specific family 4 protein, partial [Planctomycetaceae bacterium]|nr:spherulation-specific family 4 protein [Planctomycetaceae bacterium]